MFRWFRPTLSTPTGLLYLRRRDTGIGEWVYIPPGCPIPDLWDRPA